MMIKYKTYLITDCTNKIYWYNIMVGETVVGYERSDGLSVPFSMLTKEHRKLTGQINGSGHVDIGSYRLVMTQKEILEELLFELEEEVKWPW